ncbi:MAG: hypothetical protein ABIJ10_05570 [Candidatus Micrarchaeota archaeon]
MKTFIFIVGRSRTGKSSMVRALTGCWNDRYWKVKDLDGNQILALVLFSAIGERPKVSLGDFVNELEAQVKAKRGNEIQQNYDMIICPLRSNLRNGATWKYINSAKTLGYDVRVAGIEIDWEKNKIDLDELEEKCKENNIPYLQLDTSEDYNIEARKLRLEFYPKKRSSLLQVQTSQV